MQSLRLIVVKYFQGLCAYVTMHVRNATSRGVVIGHDHRYNSERWARLTAAAFIANGVKAYLFSGIVHTPMYVNSPSVLFNIEHSPLYSVPFSVKKLGAACGVMITGAHPTTAWLDDQLTVATAKRVIIRRLDTMISVLPRTTLMFTVARQRI